MPSNQQTSKTDTAKQSAQASPEAAAAPAEQRQAGPSPELRAALTAPPGVPSADELWQVHRAALGGVSSASGQPLPDRLADAPDGARKAHYAMARYVAQRFGAAPADKPEHLPDDVVDEVSRLLTLES
jgi:hypothetical protein